MEGCFKLNLKQLYCFIFKSWTIKTITYAIHVDDTNNSHQYDMIMGRELMQKLGLDDKFLDFTIRGKSPGPFEGCYTLTKGFQEVIDMDLNNEIISDNIYDGEPARDMTEHTTLIPSPNYHKSYL